MKSKWVACVSDWDGVDGWESENRRLSLNSPEPNLFGWRPSALKRYLCPQNKLKLSIKFLPLSLRTLEGHVFSPSRWLNVFIPLSTVGRGPLMNDLMSNLSSVSNSPVKSLFNSSDCSLRMSLNPVCTIIRVILRFSDIIVVIFWLTSLTVAPGKQHVLIFLQRMSLIAESPTIRVSGSAACCGTNPSLGPLPWRGLGLVFEDPQVARLPCRLS